MTALDMTTRNNVPVSRTGNPFSVSTAQPAPRTRGCLRNEPPPTFLWDHFRMMMIFFGIPMPNVMRSIDIVDWDFGSYIRLVVVVNLHGETIFGLQNSPLIRVRPHAEYDDDGEDSGADSDTGSALPHNIMDEVNSVIILPSEELGRQGVQPCEASGWSGENEPDCLMFYFEMDNENPLWVDFEAWVMAFFFDPDWFFA